MSHRSPAVDDEVAKREGTASTTIAHVSDWHATTLEGASARELATKRFFGWLSWRRKRRFVHRSEMLERILRDVRESASDAVVVTGDLTNVALPQEFEEASTALRDLGSPDHVFVVPGNHDAYVPVHASRGWDLWGPYLQSDSTPGDADPSVGPASDAANLRAPSFDEFPTQRVRGGVALIGLCSALPTGFFRATGRLGATQIARVRSLLREHGERGLARVLLIHHPVTPGVVSRRRSLLDAEALRSVIREEGAELVLHGHTHRSMHTQIAGPGAPVPVIGVRSSSDASERRHRRAQYHRFHFEPRADAEGFRVELEVRGLTDEGAVETVERRVLSPVGP